MYPLSLSALSSCGAAMSSSASGALMSTTGYLRSIPKVEISSGVRIRWVKKRIGSCSAISFSVQSSDKNGRRWRYALDPTISATWRPDRRSLTKLSTCSCCHLAASTTWAFVVFLTPSSPPPGASKSLLRSKMMKQAWRGKAARQQRNFTRSPLLAMATSSSEEEMMTISTSLDEEEGHRSESIGNAMAGVQNEHDGYGDGRDSAVIADEIMRSEVVEGDSDGGPFSSLDGDGDGDGDQSASLKSVGFDYGFQARFAKAGAAVPGSFVELSLNNFGREWKALRRNVLFADYDRITKAASSERGPLGIFGLTVLRGFLEALRSVDKVLQLYDALPEMNPATLGGGAESDKLRQMLEKLTLSNKAVWDRELARPAVKAPWIILAPYYLLCLLLDVIFNNRPVQRFWFLETVARMPYFSYISMLHLYETLGWWRVGSEVRKVHFAEEWNEMHHLKIMESLGGDDLWFDRFMGQHAAFFYYWVLNFMFLISPKMAYNFSELIEMHAVDTYGQFVDENEALLKTLPPPPIAVSYYEGDDLYMFDEFQTSRPPKSRRPKVRNLYDVFCNIRDDEGEHVKTMAACQDLRTPVTSPNRKIQPDSSATKPSKDP